MSSPSLPRQGLCCNQANKYSDLKQPPEQRFGSALSSQLKFMRNAQNGSAGFSTALTNCVRLFRRSARTGNENTEVENKKKHSSNEPQRKWSKPIRKATCLHDER